MRSSLGRLRLERRCDSCIVPTLKSDNYENRVGMHRPQSLQSGLKIFDLMVMASCFTIAAVLVAPGFDVATIREFMALRISLGNFVLLIAFMSAWHVLYTAFGLYQKPLFSDWYGEAKDLLDWYVHNCCRRSTVRNIVYRCSVHADFLDQRQHLVVLRSPCCQRIIAAPLPAR